MDNFVKNVTKETITLYDLSGIELPPNQVVNLLDKATQTQINASYDLTLSIREGWVQAGKIISGGRFAVTKSYPLKTKKNLSDINIISLSRISGHPETGRTQEGIKVTADMLLASDPTQALQAATKQYVDNRDVATLASARQADIDFHK